MIDYFKDVRNGIIFVCESSNCLDDNFFSDHKEPFVFFDINETMDLNYCPRCPACGSSDNVYQHAIGQLKTGKILNEDEEILED